MTALIVLLLGIVAALSAWNVRQGLKTGVLRIRGSRTVDRKSQPRLFKVALVIQILLTAMLISAAVILPFVPPHGWASSEPSIPASR
jgi:ABC-type Fe3+ transport system permease subunit